MISRLFFLQVGIGGGGGVANSVAADSHGESLRAIHPLLSTVRFSTGKFFLRSFPMGLFLRVFVQSTAGGQLASIFLSFAIPYIPSSYEHVLTLANHPPKNILDRVGHVALCRCQTAGASSPTHCANIVLTPAICQI